MENKNIWRRSFGHYKNELLKIKEQQHNNKKPPESNNIVKKSFSIGTF
jgi:hypothetical protein